ncbi:MAG: 4Fe-4S dicluster domain-containing protein [Calditrichaeota bacterium]|nr:MAG: 4Fe-4S dicluster domain-containing protein [Calditrichota bacterium]
MSVEANVNMQPTMVKRMEQYRDRWTSYGANTGILNISEKLSPAELKKYPIFKDYDDKFLEKISPDISLVTWKKDAVLFEEGSYIDLAFFLIKGKVQIYLSGVAKENLLNQPIFNLSRTIMGKQVTPVPGPKEEQDMGQTVFQTQIKKQSRSSTDITFLSTLDVNLPPTGVLVLEEGEIFGEIGALSGWPQSVTAKTLTDCELLQIRVPALRQMKRKSKSLKARLDKLYRDRALFAQLKSTPLFQKCEDAFIESLKEKVELISCETDEIIMQEGQPVDALYMVRSGFVKLQQRMGEGNIVVSYLSKGMTLGEIELLNPDLKGAHFTATSVENTELVKINKNDFKNILKRYPDIEKMLWEYAVARIKEAGYNRKNLARSEFIETALMEGLVEGNSILVIDLEICTRCDDCVRGCADTHGGIPRFVREGEKYENLLITRACYHCEDPLCLIGCPTGAIRRAGIGEVVEIDDRLCIGCQTCAKNCPYDAITMYEVGGVWPENMVPEGLRGKERLLATKCDLCYSTGHGPACVSNCPHGCAIRVGSVEEFQQLLTRG